MCIRDSPYSLHDPNASVPRMDDMDNTDRTYDMPHYNKKNHLDHSSSQLVVSGETPVSYTHLDVYKSQDLVSS